MHYSFKVWSVAASLTVAALTVGGVLVPAASAQASERGEAQAESVRSTDTPTLPPATLPAATVGQPFSYRFVWSGDAIVPATKLPQGFTLSKDGVLSGTPTMSIVGTTTLKIRASTHSGESDEWPITVDRSFSLTVLDSPLGDVQGQVPEVILGQAYSSQVPLAGQGARVQSSNRPGWLQVDSTGKLTGTAPTNRPRSSVSRCPWW